MLKCVIHVSVLKHCNAYTFPRCSAITTETLLETISSNPTFSEQVVQGSVQSGFEYLH